MAAKYNFSRQIGNETFQVVNCDSFDEAIKIVDKATNHPKHNHDVDLNYKVEINPPKTNYRTSDSVSGRITHVAGHPTMEI